MPNYQQSDQILVPEEATGDAQPFRGQAAEVVYTARHAYVVIVGSTIFAVDKSLFGEE